MFFTEAIAIGLLLAATAHWWPFVFFLLPTVAVHAVGTAKQVVKQFDREPTTPRLSFALFTALIGAFGGQWPCGKAMLRKVINMYPHVRSFS